jgi:hypothetical protein
MLAQILTVTATYRFHFPCISNRICFAFWLVFPFCVDCISFFFKGVSMYGLETFRGYHHSLCLRLTVLAGT